MYCFITTCSVEVAYNRFYELCIYIYICCLYGISIYAEIRCLQHSVAYHGRVTVKSADINWRSLEVINTFSRKTIQIRLFLLHAITVSAIYWLFLFYLCNVTCVCCFAFAVYEE